jgi:hypothetical protein
MEGHDRLAADQAEPGIRRAARNRQALAVMGWAAWVTAVGATGGPPLVNAVMGAPAGVLLVAETYRNRAAFRRGPANGVDPAQAQLRSVRTDLLNGVDKLPPAGSRDLRAAKNRPSGPSR